jgi:hypothetical protein
VVWLVVVVEGYFVGCAMVREMVMQPREGLNNCGEPAVFPVWLLPIAAQHEKLEVLVLVDNFLEYPANDGDVSFDLAFSQPFGRRAE